MTRTPSQPVTSTVTTVTESVESWDPTTSRRIFPLHLATLTSHGRRPLRYAKITVASPGRTRIAAARRAASAHARRDSCVRRWGFACSWILALRASFYMPKAEYPAFPGARAARMMHLLQVYDTAQLRGYPRIVREYLVYSAFSLRHVRWGVGGIKVTPPRFRLP